MILRRLLIGYIVWMFLVVWDPVNTVFAQNNLGRSPLTSPRIVNLDGNPGTLKIVVGDEAGNLNGFNGRGALLWQVALRIDGVFPTSIQGTPAVADVDGDGLLEIVATTGNMNFQSTNPGGVFVADLLDAGGIFPPILRQILKFDNRSIDPPDNVPDSSVVSPAIADVNGDGTPDIVVGSFDQVVRAIDINGFPLWFEFVTEPIGPVLYGGLKTGDTIFSSPAVANIDFDPQAEVIIGIEANDSRDCFAPLNFTLAKKGGAILFIDGFTGKPDTGLLLPANIVDPACPNKIKVRANINKPINSTAAVADINGDFFSDIVIGSSRSVPGFPTTGATVFAVSSNGKVLWTKSTGGSLVPSSPAIGDVDGDGLPEVFVRTENNRLYGFRGNTGAILPGFPVTLISAANGVNAYLSSPVLGDTDGDTLPEILVVAFGNLNIVKSNGAILQAIPVPNLLNNTPAIGDIDGDGLNEIVVMGDAVQIIQTTGRGIPPWPQFKANAEGTSKR